MTEEEAARLHRETLSPNEEYLICNENVASALLLEYYNRAWKAIMFHNSQEKCLPTVITIITGKAVPRFLRKTQREFR